MVDENLLKKHNLLEARERFKSILEYIQPSFGLDEEGDEEQTPDMGGGDPSMGGGMPPMGGADPNMGGAPTGPDAMGGAPNAGGDMGADPNTMGGGEAPADPSMEGGATPEGLAPQGQPEQLGDTADEDPNAEEEEVIDVDDLTNSQEATEQKIDALSDKFEKLMGMLDNFESRVDASNERMESLRAEIEKRNPTPVEKMTLRSGKSAPFAETPEEWWDKHAPENYSTEDDENGAHDPQYQITKADIDNINDWRAISKSFDDERMSLKDLLDY